MQQLTMRIDTVVVLLVVEDRSCLQFMDIAIAINKLLLCRNLLVEVKSPTCSFLDTHFALSQSIVTLTIHVYV